FCDVSEATTAPGIVACLAATLDVALVAGEALADGARELGRVIEARGAVLLMLDNFEQVVAGAAATVGRWLDLCPSARFLVTSRERLRLEGETCVELEPLPASLAVRLFQERAR